MSMSLMSDPNDERRHRGDGAQRHAQR